MFPLKDTNPSDTIPYVNFLIIIANIFMFGYQLSLGYDERVFVMNYGFVPDRFFACFSCVDISQRIVPVFSSMFMHGGFFHLLGNMYFLYIFGDNVEDQLGHQKYFFIYLLFGICAVLTQGFAAPASTVPMIGASGAVAGVMGAYIVFFPKAKIKTLVIIIIFITIMEIPAFVFLLIWFLIQLNKGIDVGAGVAGVAWWAHIGGFAAGVIYAFLFKKKQDEDRDYRDINYIDN